MLHLNVSKVDQVLHVLQCTPPAAAIGGGARGQARHGRRVGSGGAQTPRGGWVVCGVQSRERGAGTGRGRPSGCPTLALPYWTVDTSLPRTQKRLSSGLQGGIGLSRRPDQMQDNCDVELYFFRTKENFIKWMEKVSACTRKSDYITHACSKFKRTTTALCICWRGVASSVSVVGGEILGRGQNKVADELVQPR
jgi:hypothetical protein